MKQRSAWRYLWTAPDIRRKLLITFALLILYRFVAQIRLMQTQYTAHVRLRWL